MFVEHPRVTPQRVERREFQTAIARACASRNTLVILPTGLGKTVVALLVIAQRLVDRPGKVLFLAPTKPLVEQHATFLRERLLSTSVCVFTGETPPEERQATWNGFDVIVATPQVIHNDLLAERIRLDGFTLLVLDEAHRAVGDYAYPFVSERFRAQSKNGRVLGMTASPGADPARIFEVCKNLGVQGVEIRTESDDDVRPYLQHVRLEWVDVAMPEQFRAVSDPLKKALAEDVERLRSAGLVRASRVGTSELLQAQTRIQAMMRERGPQVPGELYQLASVQARALKANHALELIETQGVAAIQSYFSRLEADRSKAAKQLLDDSRVRAARIAIESLKLEHPKMRRAAILVRQQLAAKPDSRIIVFTHYRDTSDLLYNELLRVEGVRPARFVGQAQRGEDKGLTQKEQVETLARFQAAEFNCLVATSVAEEGLDIPATDLVVFYEPVPSEIRTIQRRGRTGRIRPGRVVVLITKGTRDEAYYWSARGKEREMRIRIDELRKYFQSVNASWDLEEAKAAISDPRPIEAAAERPLESFSEGPERKRVAIVVDHREFSSPVVRELAARGIAVKPEQLAVADFVLSDRLAVERKEAGDFAASLVDGRLFPQLKALRASYASPVLILEGSELFTARRISPEAIYGALASIVAEFRIPILATRDAKETAALLAAMARREQEESAREVALRHEKTGRAGDDQLRFMLEGVPGVSGVLGRRLLSEFKTIAAIANANEEELRRVDGVGPVLAKRIHDIFHQPYKG